MPRRRHPISITSRAVLLRGAMTIRSSCGLLVLSVCLVAGGCASGGSGDTGAGRLDGGRDGGGIDAPLGLDAPRDAPMGACFPACGDLESCCGTACVDVTTNPNHCGACGNRCAMGVPCVAGACMAATCTPACDAGETCMDGACRCGAGAGCGDGLSCCGGGCVDPASNTNHCGACGRRCAAGESCEAGTCTAPTCTPACAAGETCVAGRCLCGGATCTASQRCCAGRCTTLDTVANCGACGRTCGGTEACCEGICTNVSTNVDNCGRCGRTCDADRTNGCTGGVCTCNGGSACVIACAPIVGCFPL